MTISTTMIYAIGDIHGCLGQLQALLDRIEAHASARAFRGIFLGDYVDRGPNSREVVTQVRNLLTGGSGHGTWSALKGNHEDLMVKFLAGLDREEIWQSNGGLETLQSYAGYQAQMLEDAEWLASLPTMIETENHIFVHAGLSPRYAVCHQPEEVRLWIRHWENEDHDFGKHVVYGHTPRDDPKLLARSSGLDTGACYSGPLTAGVFDETKAAGPVEILQAW